MKTEQKRQFEPITITLETEDEAKILYVLLSSKSINSVNEMLKNEGLKTSKTLSGSYDVGYHMYQNFTEVYEP